MATYTGDDREEWSRLGSGTRDQEELADPDDELEEWVEAEFPTVAGPSRRRLVELKADLEAAEERARTETRARQRLQRQAAARPASGLVIDGEDLGPWLTAGTYLLAAGLGFGVGLGVE